MQPELKQYLEQHDIKYILHEHPAVFTCEEADIHCKHIPGMPGKNLFLKSKDKKGRTQDHFLVIMPAVKRLNLKALQSQLEVKKLTFSKPEELKEILGLTPGSVSPFGLINDTEKKVKVIIDKELWETEIVTFHPNVNTASLELSKEEFHRFIESLGHNVQVIELES